MAAYTSPVSGKPVPTPGPGGEGYANFKNSHTCPSNGKTCFNWVVQSGTTGVATATASGYSDSNIRLWAYDHLGNAIQSSTNSISLPNPPNSDRYRFTAFFMVTPLPSQCTLTLDNNFSDYVCP